MPSKKTDCFTSSFEKVAYNPADEIWQEGRYLFANVFQSISEALASCFRRVSNGANDSGDCNPGGIQDRGYYHAIFFFKIALILSQSGSALSLSPICVCKPTRSSILSATLPSAAYLSKGEALQLGFLLFQHIQRSCAVKPFFLGIYFSSFFSKVFSEFATPLLVL